MIAVSAVATAANQTVFTNKILDAEGQGNSLSIPAKAFFAAASCSNALALSNWDAGASNAPNPSCQGVNSLKGVLQFAQGNTAFISFELPPDWNPSASVDLRIAFTTADATVGDVTAWDLQTACNSIDGTATDDPVLNAAQTATATIASSGVANAEYVATQTGLNMAGCQPGSNLVVEITRDTSPKDTNGDLAVAAKWVEITFGRTLNKLVR
jgi:hypothetical protein